MLERLNADLAREQEDVAETERAAENLEQLLLDGDTDAFLKSWDSMTVDFYTEK